MYMKPLACKNDNAIFTNFLGVGGGEPRGGHEARPYSNGLNTRNMSIASNAQTARTGLDREGTP